MMVYEIINKFWPENLRNKFHQRSHYTKYDYNAIKVWNEIPVKISELPALHQYRKQKFIY